MNKPLTDGSSPDSIANPPRRLLEIIASISVLLSAVGAAALPVGTEINNDLRASQGAQDATNRHIMRQVELDGAVVMRQLKPYVVLFVSGKSRHDVEKATGTAPGCTVQPVPGFADSYAVIIEISKRDKDLLRIVSDQVLQGEWPELGSRRHFLHNNDKQITAYRRMLEKYLADALQKKYRQIPNNLSPDYIYESPESYPDDLDKIITAVQYFSSYPGKELLDYLESLKPNTPTTVPSRRDMALARGR